jgi:cell wall-associated NlpC family hydrolase
MRLIIFTILLAPFIALAQNRDFDRLEILYDQGHYKKVLRRANKLANKPEYVNAVLPSYYRSMAMLQLYRNEKWRRRNPSALEAGVQLFLDMKKRDADGLVFAAHIYEIQSLKRDYDYFLEELEQDKKKNAQLIAEIRSAYTKLFSGVKDIQDAQPTLTSPPQMANISDTRRKIVEFAYKHVGVKYRSGGNDPNGFDCSGFVSFVFNEFKIDLPRISGDQQKKAVPLKVLDVQPGDLVFFANGANVNHVGIVVENKNGIVTMIHASSSKGIVVTEINTSNYWNNRVHSYGTFLR